MEAVLFDMDGVLVDSEDYWHPAERERVFPSVLAGEIPDLDEVTGMYYRDIYDYLDANYETTVSKEEFVEKYDDLAAEIYGEKVTLLEGVPDLLTRLRERGVATGIVSSSPPDWISIVLDRFDLEFDAVASTETIDGEGKPEPDPYEAAAAALGVDPEDAVAVEDSVNGVRSAARAGTFVVAYRTDHNADADLSAADLVVGSPEELRDAILGRV